MIMRANAAYACGGSSARDGAGRASRVGNPVRMSGGARAESRSAAATRVVRSGIVPVTLVHPIDAV
jgi:hypothetical protein